MKVSLYFIFLTIISFFSTATFGQHPVKTYDKQWDVMEDFITKGHPKSALEEVKKIYQLAKREKQDAQVIKSALYMMGLQDENREDNEIQSIHELEKEASQSQEPAKSILNSLTASAYYHYYQNNRWNLYHRTQTAGFKKEDIATWGTEDFHRKISALYLASIKDESLLKRTRLEPFDAIINKGNTRKLRPTLFDLLAFEALKYFSSDERDIKKPSYAFEIRSAAAFDPNTDFIHRKFETKDTSALEYKALLIYQRLISFHLDDVQPNALIDADIHRIEFVRTKSTHPDKDHLYDLAMNHLANQYGATPAAAQAWYATAEWHSQKGKTYSPNGDTTHRLELKKAIPICEKIIRENPGTEGGVNALNLMNQLKAPSLQFSLESVNIPGQPFRALVEYTNLTKVHLRVIEATEELKAQVKNNHLGNFRTFIADAPPVSKWRVNLPVTNDYQTHTVEIKVNALPVGQYFLVATTTENLRDDKSIMGSRLFYVSNISCVNYKENFFVLDRNTGQPLRGAKVQEWSPSSTSRTEKIERVGLHITNQNGYFRRQIDMSFGRPLSYRLDITHGNDRLFLDEMQHSYYTNQRRDIPIEAHFFLFTDRSIYRPGQTVHFKGIAIEGKEVLDDKSARIKIVLYGNGTELSTLTMSPSEYGTFSGQFQLPQGVLNGRFTIRAGNRDYISFQVEEYKRPKFFIQYEPIKTAYRVNDEIQITGSATAYAGNAIDGAAVRYRIVREPRFIHPWFFKRWLPSASPVEISHGEAITNSEGKFQVSFNAIPDPRISKKLDPVFDYVLYADITDSNGETRSGVKSVSASYKSILVKVNLPETMPADSLKTLSISTENTNGDFLKAMVFVNIARLKTEQRLIRERYWARPDQFVMNKTDYIKNFPNDEYDNETDLTSWPIESIVFEKSGLTNAESKWELDTNVTFPPGFYQVEATTKDKTGEEVKSISYIELRDPAGKQNRSRYLTTEKSNPVQPGETALLTLGSSADNLFLITESDRKQPNENTFPYSFSTLNQEKRTFTFTARESDRGGFSANYTFVKHNRFYEYKENIRVPWTNKDLKIEYASFRDKTLPGSQEKWKIKISGYKKEKVAAEILASMYDASLDQFLLHQWVKPNVWPVFNDWSRWNSNWGFIQISAELRHGQQYQYRTFNKTYDMLTTPFLGPSMQVLRPRIRGVSKATVVEDIKEAVVANKSAELSAGFGSPVKKDEEVPEETSPNKLTPENSPQIRTNFNETAFFFPNLHTNRQGDVEFSFTMPDALTRWKFQALAHTKDLAFGYSSMEIVTQKDLMVQPNPPRFLRQGDKISFSSKIANLTEKSLQGEVTFQLFETETNKTVDHLFKNTVKSLPFEVPAKQSVALGFPIEIPENFDKTLTWRIVAKAGNMSDGEENTLPVLPNRMLVTETIPLSMRGATSKAFRFEKLLDSEKSATLRNHSLTVEYTSNPAWYAIQALPYLMEYPYECAEQTWNRFYANALGTRIANSSPRIAAVFEQWRTRDTTALLGELQKNQELKSVLLEETPWVLAGQSDSQQKRNVALLFDLVKMKKDLGNSLDKLKKLQNATGGFCWFKGGLDDDHITQYIVSGIGHLRKLNAIPDAEDATLKQILAAALPYLDNKMKANYDSLVKQKAYIKNYRPDPLEIQYLYMRSFFPDYKLADSTQKAFTFFSERAKATWTSQNKHLQGMIALACHRTQDTVTPRTILQSLSETAVRNDELGMYWKATQSWWWYDNSIERQALLIEAFQEISNDSKTTDELRTWLLKNKQTNRWENTKATAEACYALLLQGTEWLSAERDVMFNLGDTVIRSNEQKQDAGSGYFKQIIPGENVLANMGNINVSMSTAQKESPAPSWGAVYWQYFENLDKITFAETPLKLEKKLFLEKNSDNGPLLTPITDGAALSVGDKIKVRIVLRADRAMEYVHMKDMRASALEPVNVLSEYKWQGGLGYYESTKDASTNFFFGHLPKGTFVFEYPLFVTHSGNFSNGITTIQCMYAPEFTAHSEWVRIEVRK